MTIGSLHHIEIWVPDIERASAAWGWLLTELGYHPYRSWPGANSWRLGPTYIIVEQSRDLTGATHDRCRPGLNHLAFFGGNQAEVDRLVNAGAAHGWTQLFADKYPYAGGADHYAGYLETVDGFEVELCAQPVVGSAS